ncbi:MAG: bifunctional ADP-dependent NAD(P)H-hydrate dehydratase/NAD(P)H-hydrate epimerase [Gammaproteobacteria bacterium]|nr:MAG: bifunctional ADP-dependent NAD(P)H-hydrate dehydratase/NAD(P)H-hydrate epimerase [Gammaproteobacteria bacterium]
MQQQHEPSYIEQPLFKADTIKNIEQTFVQSSKKDCYHLMELAGLAAWQLIERHWQTAKGITVVCGKGNNAGDGFVLARLASAKGRVVQVLLVDEKTLYAGDALTAYQLMLDQGIKPLKFDASFLDDQHLIVDAILGTGFKGVLRKNLRQIIETLNDYKARVDILSLDIPSGLESDTGYANPVAIKASRTVTFMALKSGMVTGDARAYCGDIDIASLDVTKSSLEQYPAQAWINDADALIDSLPRRSSIAHKGDHGHLLLIGGDYGFGGAILMSAMAAGRCGAGMLTIITRDAHVAPILTQCPEAMVRSVTGAEDPGLHSLLKNIDAVVIGPGLGQETWAQGLLEVIYDTDLPLLIDADALNILATKTRLPKKPNCVITPHPGEAGRLLGIDTSQIQKDRYQAVNLLQKKYSAVTVLKGAGTLIESYSNQTTVCNEGNPGMASAGMGDILSGIIGTLLAQGIEVSLAARIGVALHARAGDLAAMNGQKGLMATDLIKPLRMLVNQ